MFLLKGLFWKMRFFCAEMFQKKLCHQKGLFSNSFDKKTNLKKKSCVARESSKPLLMIGSLTAPLNISREAGLFC
ncbi:hypothetical protein AT239_07525 [Bartonella henselae]|nr:hypothetical protein AT240_02595 [Bartonella henselae]OLL54518.1 hypothetical protein AT239_07525 [Bartonella henselae]